MLSRSGSRASRPTPATSYLSLLVEDVRDAEMDITTELPGVEVDSRTQGKSWWKFSSSNRDRESRLKKNRFLARDEELFDSPFPRLGFAELPRFQSLVGLTILANTLVLGLETDIPWKGWWLVNQAFLFVFSTEVLLRMLFRGKYYFSLQGDLFWNLLDLTVVCLGILESWLIPIFASEFAFDHSPATLLRSLRLLRLLRLLRMFRMFDYLQRFVDALMDMFPTLVWIFTILFIFCYVTAIVLTHMLGQGEALDWDNLTDQDREELQESFGDILTTMFSLFRIITMDGWYDIARPVVENMPSWRLFFVGFIAFGSWTMISLLTAVVSDHMIAATADLKAVETRKAHELKLEFIDYLRHSFEQADTDGDGMLDREEFAQWVEDPATCERMHKVGIHMRKDEMLAMFDMFDVDNAGKLSAEEFVDGYARAPDALGMKHMLMLEHLFKRVERKVSRNASDVHRLVTQGGYLSGSEQDPTDLQNRLLAQVELLTEQVGNLVRQHGVPGDESQRGKFSRISSPKRGGC